MLQAYDTMGIHIHNVVHGGLSPMFIYKTQKQQLLDVRDLVCNLTLGRKTMTTESYFSIC